MPPGTILPLGQHFRSWVEECAVAAEPSQHAEPYGPIPRGHLGGQQCPAMPELNGQRLARGDTVRKSSELAQETACTDHCVAELLPMIEVTRYEALHVVRAHDARGQGWTNARSEERR